MNSFRVELPEVFSGEEGQDFHQWIQRFELASEVIPGANEKKHILLPARLSGAAFIVWEGLTEESKKNYQTIKDKLSQVFGRSQYLQSFRTCITARKRHTNEPLEVFASAIITLVEQAFPKYDAAAKEGESFRRFVAGLESKLQRKIHEMGGMDLKNALSIATRVENAERDVQPEPSPTVAITEVQQGNGYREIIERLDKLENKIAKLDISCQMNRNSNEHPRYFPQRSGSPSPYSPDSYNRQDRQSRYRSQSPQSRYQRRNQSPRQEHQRDRQADYKYMRSQSPQQEHRRDRRADYNYTRSPSPRQEHQRSRTADYNYMVDDRQIQGQAPTSRASRVHFEDQRSENYY